MTPFEDQKITFCTVVRSFSNQSIYLVPWETVHISNWDTPDLMEMTPQNFTARKNKAAINTQLSHTQENSLLQTTTWKT